MTALQIFTDADHEAVWAGWRAGAEHIVERLKGFDGLRIALEDGDPNRQGPLAVMGLIPKRGTLLELKNSEFSR